MIQQAFSKPCLVNLISKDTQLVFSIYRQASRFNIVLKALPGKLYIKRHSPSILYISASLTNSTSVLKALLVNLTPSILFISASLAIQQALPGKLDIKRHSPSILYILSCNVVLRISDRCREPGLKAYIIHGHCKHYWVCGSRKGGGIFAQAECCPAGGGFKEGEGCIHNPNCTESCDFSKTEEIITGKPRISKNNCTYKTFYQLPRILNALLHVA